MAPGGLGQAQSLSRLPAVPLLPSVLGVASAAEGGCCCLPNTPHIKHTVVCQGTVDCHGLIPEKGSLHKMPTRGFSICSGVLLLGAVKRPTEPAKNQSATM